MMYNHKDKHTSHPLHGLLVYVIMFMYTGNNYMINKLCFFFNCFNSTFYVLQDSTTLSQFDLV